MLNTSDTITDKKSLILFMQQSCKLKEEWKIGVEYEQFVSNSLSNNPIQYTGSPGLLDIFAEFECNGWLPHFEKNIITELKKGASSISLEPGGQIELATAPHKTIHALNAEIQSYCNTLNKISKNLNVDFMPVGAHPTWLLENILPIPDPNGRNKILFDYMKKTGTHGVDMMLRTCSIQVSLDYANESDMSKKYKIALLLQPLISTLFANSDFIDGKKTNYVSYRNYIWMNTNQNRCGILEIALNKNFNFEHYIDFMLEMPLYFVYRNDSYIDAFGEPFKYFLEGKLSILPGEVPTFNDWSNHLKSIWPEARLSNVIEMRGADSCQPYYVSALAALWVGLLYDSTSLDSCLELVKDWDFNFIEELRKNIIVQGMNAKIGSQTVREITQSLVLISVKGLMSRAKFSIDSDNELLFLDPIMKIINL